MSFKTIFIVVVSALVTIILMKNTDEVDFWIFGDASIPKLAVLGVMFGLGLIIGFMAGRPRKKTVISTHSETSQDLQRPSSEVKTEDHDYLSDEDRDYIK